MRKSRLLGTIASSIAAVGLTALAVTSANASSGEDAPQEKPEQVEYEPTGSSGPTVPGEGAEDPIGDAPGVELRKNENGDIEITRLTQEEVDAIEDAKPVQPESAE